MRFRTKITTFFAAFSLFFGTIFAFNNSKVAEVKAAESTPVYDVNSYATIMPIVDESNNPTQFYNIFGNGAYSYAKRIRSIKFTTELTADELTKTSEASTLVFEAGNMAYGADGVTEVKTNNFYIPTYLVLTNELNADKNTLFDCIVYSPVEKIYAPTSCENLFSNDGCWSSLKSITFENNAFVTTNTTSMKNMFSGLTMDTLDISNFDGSNVTDLSYMFSGYANFKNLIFPTANFAPKATTTEYMFWRFNTKSELESYDFLANLDTSNVTNMSNMFASSGPVMKDGVAETLDFTKYTKFSTANVTDMNNMFDSSGFTSINVDSFDTSKVLNMYRMFANSANLRTISFPANFGSACTNFGSMFYYCVGLQTADLTNINTDNAEDMSAMFMLCINMKSVDFPTDFDTSKVTKMGNMFAYCMSLVNLDLGAMDISSGTNVYHMFYQCSSLSCIHTTDKTLASDVSIDLPKQFADYAGVPTLDAIAVAEQTLDIRVEYFIGRWQALRTAGGEQGICAALVDKSDEKDELTMLFTMYEESTPEQQNQISTHADVEGVTIGETMQYLTDVLNGNVKTDGDYGIESNPADISTLSVNLNNETTLIIIISVLSIIAISGYYVISKRKHA